MKQICFVEQVGDILFIDDLNEWKIPKPLAGLALAGALGSSVMGSNPAQAMQTTQAPLQTIAHRMVPYFNSINPIHPDFDPVAYSNVKPVYNPFRYKISPEIKQEIKNKHSIDGKKKTDVKSIKHNNGINPFNNTYSQRLKYYEDLLNQNDNLPPELQAKLQNRINDLHNLKPKRDPSPAELYVRDLIQKYKSLSPEQKAELARKQRIRDFERWPEQLARQQQLKDYLAKRKWNNLFTGISNYFLPK